MSHEEIIRAWKDEDYRLSLDAAEQAAVPQHPAGLIDLSDTEMDATAGGGLPKPTQVRITCAGCQTQRFLTALTNCCVAFQPLEAANIFSL